ncbi:MAG: GntR family transcriptional regulator [Candidatus Microbacterium colombiense]|nr:MAG: GntR family transcriptional regulator [Microbacterium sp.]
MIITETKSFGESKQLLAEEVFHHIGQQIIDGVLPPQHRIRDVDVAEEFHVSRTPVREALQRLERLGLVMMYPSRYTEVTTVTPEIVEQTREFAGYQTGVSARLGLPRISQQQREQLAELVQDLHAALDRDDATTGTRWALFSFLSDHSGNAQHTALMNDIEVAVFRNLRDWRVPVKDRDRMHAVYAGLHDAILLGDGDAAERLARSMYYV